MKNTGDLELQDLFYELGYDEREFLDGDGWKYNRFMMLQDREARREAQTYLDKLDDCQDDYYLKLKSVTVTRIRGEQN